MNHFSRNWRYYLLLYCVLMILLTVLSGPNHDYVVYLKHWGWIAGGNDPWLFSGGGSQENAYGPVYIVFTLFYLLHPLLPKILFTLSWLGFGLWTLVYYRKNGLYTVRVRNILIAYCFVFPFFITEIPLKGHFDIIVALLTLAAIHLCRLGYSSRAGICLGLGILLKFIPVIVIPFLAYEQGKIRWRFVTTAIGTIILGFTLCSLYWGTSFLNPVLFAMDRPSKLISIFRFLRGEYSPLGFFMVNPNLDFLSLPLMAMVGGWLVIRHIAKQITSLTSCLLASIGILALYKVGHQQFFAMVFVMLPYWYLHNYQEFAHKEIKPILYYVYWFAGFCLFYSWTGGFHAFPWQFVREAAAGIVTFVVSLYLFVSVYRHDQMRASPD